MRARVRMVRGAWRWGAVALPLALVASVLVGCSAPHPSAPGYTGPRVTDAPDTGGAVAAAARQKSPVVVDALTAGDRIVRAQPDGTLTAEVSPEVVRVKQGDRWVGVDPTLVRRADGTVVPRAVDTDLALSGGGRTPLVRYGKDGASIALSWPGPLPRPVLSGPTATYPDVLPGVDLVMRAETDGYSQNLVVKTARAAQNPALASIRLGLSATGVSLRADRDGTLEARDKAGTVTFTAPPSAMWDAGTKRSVAAVAVTASTLTLRPDRALLADPHTRFPVTIDPGFASAARTGWAKVLSGLPNSPEWNGGPDGGEAKVGLCWPSDACNGIGVARTYVQYDTGFLAGKQIISASLNTTITHSPSCQQRNLQAFLANGQIGPGTTWNNAPQGAGLEVKPADVVYSGCDGYKPLGFGVTGAVRAGGVSTYFIKAVDEGDGYAWRKLDPLSTNLVVNFDTAPNAPYELGTDPPLPAPCRWCGGTPYVGDSSIRLTTRLSDPDNDLLKPIWDIAGGGSAEHRDAGPTQGSGAVFDTTVDLSGRNGQTVSWQVTADDGTLRGPTAGGPGPFVVDEVGVTKQPGVSAKLYKEDNAWHGGVGVPDQFTFDAAGVADIDHYLYGWQDPPSTKVDASALGGPATVTITPPGDGPRDLYVQSVDRAGHRSPTRVYHFYVRGGNGPYAQWAFEGNANDTAFLGDNNGTLSGDAAYAPGAVGTGLKLSGAGAVTAPNAVHTDTSFSVSAWVKLDSAGLGFARAAVSQDGVSSAGGAYSGFDLWYRPENGGKWVFGLPLNLTGTAGADMAWSSATAQPDVWTHLVGVYDAPAKQLKLYVNGELSGTANRTVTPWQAAGSLRIGQTLWGGSLVDNWVGQLDEVQAYDRVLTDTEVKAMVSRDNVQVGEWKFDETDRSTKTALNAVPGGDMAVLSGGASFVADQNGGAVRLDGTSGYLSTGRPEFQTDHSFSVSAWVTLDNTGTPRAIVSQDGANGPGFVLSYRPDKGNTWVFAMPDATGAGGDAAVSSVTAQAGVATHLVGVYDAGARQLRLYVNGSLADGGSAASTVTPWNATGPFEIGRAMTGAATFGNYWAGTVDDVRAYSRVLAPEEIQAIVSQSNVAAGTWKLDGDATDSSGSNRNGTTGGGVAWAGGQTSSPDPSDLAAQLNGADAYVSAPHAVDTSRSFSAAAWVRLDKAGGHYGVVSQDGAATSTFKVEADPGGGWSFTMFTQDGVAHRAIGGTAQLGVWTHLAGVYDAGDQQLQLYVNGVLAATAAFSGAWDYPAGQLEIGRNRINSGPTDYFPGAIDDVSVYSRALFADEIRQMAGRDLTLVHNWALDEPSGTEAADSIGTRTGTLSGGATFASGRVGNAVALDGTGSVVSTSGVDLHTDDSFTVTAWVRLDAKDCDLTVRSQCKVDAVSLDGDPDGTTTKFRLGHVIDDDQNQLGAWTFEMAESNSPDSVVKAVVSTDPTEVNQWVHLTGVYDKGSKKIWLYVNAARMGDATVDNAWNATGGLQIGRGTADGKPAEYWPGSVDDVRMYTGALDKDRISTLYHSYPAAPGPDTLPTAAAGQWNFDEGSGTTVADATSNGNDATLMGGTGWTGGRAGHAAWLDGTSGYAQTARPVLTTSASFSVTAWAYLTRSGGTTNATVVGQDGNRVSAFAVVYNAGNNRWSVFVTGADQDNPSTVELDSAEPAALGNWTHLGVVYDASLRQLRLYVNGMLSAAQVGVSTWNATGPFTIGRGKWNGQNATFFPRGIDDVRAYPRALSDGEIRKIHDDGGSPTMSAWRFDDGTGRDYAGWRSDNATVSGGATYPAGVSGTGIQFDGTTGSATAGMPGVDTRDSFTVSAWARLSRLDRIATVVGQDGSRMSGFVLQYRPDKDNKWVFAAPAVDADSAALAYAASVASPKVNEWTQLTGVYDYAARQLRLYVDGQLAGVRNNVALWHATGGLTIGRDTFNGKPDQYFPGTIDEVVTSQGAVPDAEIATRASWAAPAGGQLGRFVNATGDHYTGSTDVPAPDGYHFEATLGMLVSGGRDNTRTLYACLYGTDGFTSPDPACEGQKVVGAIGSVYTSQPTNVPTIPVYRCNTGPDHFDSRQSDCGGATDEQLLGYTLAYAPLVRYRYNIDTSDHAALVDGAPPGYRSEEPLGLLALTAQSGTQQLNSCLAGSDDFTSLDAKCEGQRVRGVLGQVWTDAPAGQTSEALYRCNTGNDHFVSPYADCEGQTVEGRLGYALTTDPDIEPIFQ